MYQDGIVLPYIRAIVVSQQHCIWGIPMTKSTSNERDDRKRAAHRKIVLFDVIDACGVT